MNRIIDTEDKILCGDNHPQLKIGNKLYVVDDRKSTFDKIQKVESDNSLSEDEKDRKRIELALGKEACKEIYDNPELTVSGHAALTFYVMAAITGEDYEELRKEARKSKN